MYYLPLTMPILEIVIIAGFHIISNIINGGEDLLELYNGGL